MLEQSRNAAKNTPVVSIPKAMNTGGRTGNKYNKLE